MAHYVKWLLTFERQAKEVLLNVLTQLLVQVVLLCLMVVSVSLLLLSLWLQYYQCFQVKKQTKQAYSAGVVTLTIFQLTLIQVLTHQFIILLQSLLLQVVIINSHILHYRNSLKDLKLSQSVGVSHLLLYLVHLMHSLS